ncbi:MAG: Mrp/NBP35 family ATP-binding protein [Actinobacteria bacterium]|nr:Mrp/NBP35 family ATP-binding protein [Actinomycetota bacterium]MBU1492376.1 Mrp/NBP35 family ATP-binding protein [Actinomycetota bacterium]
MPETTTQTIESALGGVLDPELGVDIVELGMVRGIEIDGTAATIHIALTIAACPLRTQIEGDVVRKVIALPGIDSVDVQVTAMTDRQRSELMGIARRNARDTAAPTMVNPMTRVIAVGSGKGGVGKSSISVNLAVAIADTGYRVGLLDADIWGFSIPRMLGITGRRLEAGDDRKIVPMQAAGIQVVSTGLMLDDEQTALMWRGLMLSKALEQFLHDVAWDRDLDYLVIDMPPGTGDIQMALARLLPQAEMVVVTTPQKAAQKVAARVADMARRSFLPVVGVVENMAGFTTDDGTHYDLFGKGGGEELAAELGVPLIGSIPLDPFVVEGGDDGAPVVRAHPDAPSARAVAGVAARILELVPPAADETCTARIAVLMEQLGQDAAG